MNQGRITVLVPTLRRPESLAVCLRAIAAQTRAADEVIVIVRDGDTATLDLLSETAPSIAALKIVTTNEIGVVAAMNAGLAAATGDIIALTDDDAAPWKDWLERIAVHFDADGRVAGVGGRDWQYRDGKLDDGFQKRPGELSFWGRLSAGHHHAAPGPAREVDAIKGVNSAYRAAALRSIGFDTRLRGSGAQVHWELGLCLTLKRAGWKIVFDPAIGVDHFPAVRFDEDQRGHFNAVAHRNAVANETYIMLMHYGRLRGAAYMFWTGMIGTSSYPGVLQLMRLLLTLKPHPLAGWWATVCGRMVGARMFFQFRNPSSAPASQHASSTSARAVTE